MARKSPKYSTKRLVAIMWTTDTSPCANLPYNISPQRNIHFTMFRQIGGLYHSHSLSAKVSVTCNISHKHSYVWEWLWPQCAATELQRGVFALRYNTMQQNSKWLGIILLWYKGLGITAEEFIWKSCNQEIHRDTVQPFCTQQVPAFVEARFNTPKDETFKWKFYTELTQHKENETRFISW
jgi:hypothetical protein